jgi:hypothetical protein
MSDGQNDKKSKVIGKFSEIKSNIESFISDVNVNDIKSSFNIMVKDAQKGQCSCESESSTSS